MIEWLFGEPIDRSVIRNTEKAFGVTFPDDYVECVLKNNGGSPMPNVYDFEGRKGAVFGRLLNHDPNGPNNILRMYDAIQDRLPEGIYPFAEDTFGNFICFDYRQDKENPSIVFWDHEKTSCKTAIFPVCRSFTELLNKLYEPEDDEDIDW